MIFKLYCKHNFPINVTQYPVKHEKVTKFYYSAHTAHMNDRIIISFFFIIIFCSITHNYLQHKQYYQSTIIAISFCIKISQIITINRCN